MTRAQKYCREIGITLDDEDDPLGLVDLKTAHFYGQKEGYVAALESDEVKRLVSTLKTTTDYFDSVGGETGGLRGLIHAALLLFEKASLK